MTIRILHCSDAHLKKGMLDDPYHSGHVLTTFLCTVDKLSMENPFDFVFLTGDVGNTGARKDYEEALLFVDRLQAAARVERGRMFFVPGNHDVDRGRGRGLNRTLNSEDESLDFFRSAGWRRNYQNKLNNYQKFLAEAFPSLNLADEDVVTEPQVVDVHNIKVGVLPLNSAWFSIGNDDHGKLWVGKTLVLERAEKLRRDGAEFIIALTHHPSDYLHDHELAWNDLRAKCDVILRGHLHRPDVRCVNTHDDAVLELAAGAICQHPSLPKSAQVVELSVDANGRWLTVEPWKYRNAPSAITWIPDLDIFGTERARLSLDGQQVHRPPPAWTPFPFGCWKRVTALTWQKDIMAWLAIAYPYDPDRSIRALVEHFVEILQHSGHNTQAEAVQKLAEAIVGASDSGTKFRLISHHRMVMELFATGLHAHLSHLFMLPFVNTSDLLETAHYAKVLLATRRLAQGYYDRVLGLTERVTCCIAEYCAGQALRRKNDLEGADEQFQDLEERLDDLDNHPCPISCENQCICDTRMFRAEFYRARAVVFRKQEDKDDLAKEYFDMACKAIDDSPERDDEDNPQPTNMIRAERDDPGERVKADVYFSTGYFHYQHDRYDEAMQFFEKAIQLLRDSRTQWDSPFTRQAIVKLLLGKPKEASDLFRKARRLCDKTITTNREASLSCALCGLGLKIIAEDYKIGSGRVQFDEELTAAIDQEPRLGKGPLDCHVQDALKLLTACHSGCTRQLTQDFIDQLNKCSVSVPIVPC